VSVEDQQVSVPLLRSQLRGFEILDALRLHRQGRRMGLVLDLKSIEGAV
jgi:hypothetical protein